MSGALGDVGFLLLNGCRITHGHGGNIKHPFPAMMPNLTMHELSPSNLKGFRGQLGFIQFNTDIRLPRHIHMDAEKTKLVDERIMVLHGVGLVELAGEYFVIAPGSLVDAVSGVLHTWTACPAGVKLPHESVSNGTFTMVYEYEESTSFFPTQSMEVVKKVEQYQPYDGDLDRIRLPKMSAEKVVQKARLVFDRSEVEGGLSLVAS